MATIKQVSEQAGVSQATVSRVMNGSARVSDATRARVEAAMTALGYRPNAFAQSLASNRSNSIGLVVSELNGPFYGQLMEGLEQTLRRAGKTLLIASTHSDAALEEEAVEFLLSRRCDALALHTERLSDHFLSQLQQRVPVVFLNRSVSTAIEHSIFLRNRQGGFIATDHLLELGHRSIACITGPLWKQDALDRLQGYQEALLARGIRLDDTLVVEGQFSEGSGREAMARLLARERHFSALFAGDDDIAIGAMQVLRENGYGIPSDISVIGFDDAPYARYLTPSLSTVYNPVAEMARSAGQMLLHRVYGLGDCPQNEFSPTLVIRQSTARL